MRLLGTQANVICTFGHGRGCGSVCAARQRLRQGEIGRKLPCWKVMSSCPPDGCVISIMIQTETKQQYKAIQMKAVSHEERAC
jgi:hypothetical protein